MPGMQNWIDFDNNATTQPLGAVVEAMTEVLRDGYGNPSSMHPLGQAARHRVECARAQVAALVRAEPREIFFTGSGTESLTWALRGTVARTAGKRRVVISQVEHHATDHTAEALAADGCAVIKLAVDARGQVDPAALEDALTDDTALVSLIWANNETGVLLDVERLVSVAASRGVPVHLDAVQAAGKLAIDLARLPVQLLSLAAHKFHGPKGVGALFVRRRTRLAPLLMGGGQESGMRASTENVAGIVGMGIAAEAAARMTASDYEAIRAKRDRLEVGLSRLGNTRVNGSGAPRLCNTSNMGFCGLSAEAMLILLGEQGIGASAGAACASGSLEPSHVLRAMQVEEPYAHGSMRFSLSRFTTDAEVDRVLEVMDDVVAKLSGMRV
jgi:cysteine desulfurase